MRKSILDLACSRLPFTEEISTQDIFEKGNSLLNMFDLKAQTEIIFASAIQAVELERVFRLVWWLERNDSLRSSMHILGMEIDNFVKAKPSSRLELHEAWYSADQITNSYAWRDQFKSRLILDSSNQEYYQIFFRIAQQIVNRAARWEAIFTQLRPTPYTILFDLVVAGVLPLGMYKGKLFFHKLTEDSFTSNIQFDINLKRHIVNKKICFCYEFNNIEMAVIIQNKLIQEGYFVECGPVNESIQPIEHQLADRILRSSWLVVLIKEIDADFGYPIWIHQEVDLALVYKIPIILIAKSSAIVHYPQYRKVIFYDEENYNSLYNELFVTFNS